jgi:hypothetical protein
VAQPRLRASPATARAQTTATAAAAGGSGSGAGSASDATPPARTRAQLIADAMARVPAITEGLAALRGRSLAPVPASLQTKEAFRAYVEAQVAADASTQDLPAQSRALAAVGLLEKPIDLAATFTTAYASNGAAYYDPDSRSYKVVVVPGTDMEFDLISAHELTHALQDQHFDLRAYVTPALSEDQASARRFIVEGDGMFTAFAYLIKNAGQDPLTPPVLGKLGGQLRTYGELSMADMASLVTGDLNSVMAIEDLPPYVLMPTFEAYLKGAYAAYVAFAAGGWPKLDALYSTAPPASTEQVLHPVDKLVCRRDEPQAIAIPKTAAGKGWTHLASGIAGEMGVRVYGTTWKLAATTAMAAGWDGDAWAVFTGPTPTSVDKSVPPPTLALWATTWDTPTDATEFATAIEASLAPRGVTGKVATKGTRVDVVLGCDGKACAAPLAALATLHPKKAPKEDAVTELEAACIAAFAPPPPTPAGT